MRLRPTTVRARLTAWYSGILAIPLAILAMASYVTFERSLVQRTDQFIGDALTAFTRELQAERRYLPDLDDALRTTVREVRFRDLDIAILDSTGRLLALSEPLHPEAPPTMAASVVREVQRRRGDTTVFTMPRGAGGGLRLLARSLDEAGPGHLLVGAYPLREVEATLGRIRTMFLLAIPLLIVAAGTGGYFLAKRSLAPVAAMAARAAEIGATTLHERLPVQHADELGHLATVLNALFDRLEGAFTQQRRFMADASHELRTPAAIIRTESDVTLSRPHRTEAEYRESAAIVLNASRRLSRVVDDLLLAARADAGQVVARPADIYLEDVAHEALEALRPIAEGRQVTLEFAEVVEAPLRGDADLLGRVFLNLLDNAIRHAPAGSAVQLSLRVVGATYEASVVDAGPGIPPPERERIFERFVRLDPARTPSEQGGAGLGLGIARRIAAMHGGSLTVRDAQPGRTEFVLVLPRPSDA